VDLVESVVDFSEQPPDAFGPPEASIQRLKASTFSCDIARAVSRYSRSPAASSASARLA
jgi:hypothetical protein